MTPRALRRSATIVVAVTALVVAIVLVISNSQPKRYDATASLLFGEPRPELLLFGPGFGGSTSDQQAATNAIVVASQDVARVAARRLDSGLGADDIAERVDVAQVGDTNVVDITARETSPRKAASLATTYARAFRDDRQASDRRRAGQARAALERQLNQLSRSERRGQRGASLREQIGGLTALERISSGSPELVQRASRPTEAAVPQVRRNVLFGGLFGVALGIALAAALTRPQASRAATS